MFFKKKKEQNLKEVLKRIDLLEKKTKEMWQKIKKVEKEESFSIKKIGLVRYNAFSEVGGNQSFSLALLDEKNSGIVITSLYGREENRIFAKPIKEGNSFYKLSKEEKEAVKKASKMKDGK